jgi:hypothetical protein
VDGRQPEVRFSIWSVGDLFISLSDNVQETFGLTPVEAMAAGLPAVISDWNGYRDTVRNGVDGFRIRTLMPSAGLGDDLAYRFANDWEGYGAFIGVTSQFTAVDVGAATDAVASLVADPDLRARMGAAAQARARAAFDWRSIIPLYESLWAELNAVRRVDEKPAASRPRDNPWRMDPFHLFQSYPTESLGESSLVAWAPGVNRAVAVGVIDSQPHVKLGLAYLPNREELERVFELLSMSSQLRLKDLLDRVPGRRGHVERGLVWLAKYGLLEITAPGAPT